MPDNELIDPSEADVLPVKPIKLFVYLFALMAGIGIPYLWIMIADAFSTNVRKDEDIRRITDIPIIGYILHSQLKKIL